MTNTIPNRESDAGPDDNKTPRISRQSMYSLLVDEALEAVRDLDRCYRDHRTDEQRVRLETITRAMDALEQLKEVV